MPRVTESVEIAAPVEEVFSFVADRPERATSFLPGLDRIENVAPAEAAPGQTWDFEFDWFGLVISGQSRCTVLDRPRNYRFQTETGSKSTWHYSFAPSGNGTRVTLDVEYDVPANQLARYASAGVLEKMNQERAAQTLTNLKGLLEG
jgi:carbon monoxide dehydrogenase subunit G